MTSHWLDDVLDARAARTLQRPALPVAVQGWRAIPLDCGECTWLPDTSTVPATWRLVKASPRCKVHGTAAGNEGNGGRA